MSALILFGALLFFVGSKSKAKSAGRELPAPKDGLREFVCTLVREGVPLGAILPALLREFYPAVSWPASGSWSTQEVAQLPAADRATYGREQKSLAALLKDGDFLSSCASSQGIYGAGRLRWRSGSYQVTWSYPETVSGDSGGSLTVGGFDAARSVLLERVWWFGAPAAQSDDFVGAYVKPGTQNRMSVWEMAGGGFRALRIMGAEGQAEYTQHATAEGAWGVMDSL